MSFALPLISLVLSSMSTASVPPEIENEQVLGEHKEPWHSVLMPYPNLNQALAADRYASGYARSLNGQWKFHWVKRPELRPVDFYQPGYDVSGWKTIPVPSNVEVQGYGTPFYRNNGYTFQRDWPRVMTEPPKAYTAYDERNPVSSYRREFTVPANWDGRRVFLTFDGVDSAFFLWVNGQKVGYSQNSRNAAEFDITKYLKRGGPNTLAVEVYRYSSGSYYEDQDMWRLSGIFRNVTLWSAPNTHVRDFAITTDLDENYRNATLGLVAKVHRYAGAGGARTLTATLYDRTGKAVPGGTKSIPVPAPALGGESRVTMAMPVANPAKWTAETPNLYTVVLTLKGGGKTEELLSQRVGFRKIEIKGRVFTINGVPVKLKGANRHEMNPNTGHYVTEADMIQDLVMLKRANCNHVRTCHYSDDPRWYELCDQWGIYLVAEANAESHGYYGVIDREPRFEKMVVDRNVANVEEFKNHPSVVIWSLGNECGGGSNFRAANEAVQKLDPTRPTHYEPFGIGDNNPASIDSQMYTSIAGTADHATDAKLTKPFYLCEYAHAMNNSMGSIGEYNDVFDKYPNLMGGAIWEWEDQGLWNRRDPKRPYLAYGGGFGDFPNDGYFIHKGVVFSDRSPKPHFPEAKRAYQWIGFAPDDLAAGRIKVKNKFAFTNLKEYAMAWTLTADGKPVASGAFPALDLAPGKETTLDVRLPRMEPSAGTEYFLNLTATLKRDMPWAKAGYDIANAQFEMPWKAAATPSASVMPAVRLAEDAGSATVTGEGFSATFDKATGKLSAFRQGDANVILPDGGPQLYLWRAEHRNDDGYAARDWNRMGLRDLKGKVTAFEAKTIAPNQVRVTVSTQYVGKAGFTVNHTANYTVSGDGSVAVDNSVSPTGKKIVLARVGVRMMLDKGLDRLTYLGRGPMENYADRKRGSDVGLYASTVAEQLTPYSKPMECGNHEDVRWIALGAAGKPTLVAQSGADALMQFSALPYTDEEMDPVAYSVDLPKSKATVLCLDAKTLGVGSASCGPRPLPQYIVDSSPVAFSYTLRLAPQGANLSEVGRMPVTAGRPHPAVAAIEKGMVTLGGEQKLEVSRDGQTWTAYTEPFAVKDDERFLVRSTNEAGDSVTGAFVAPVMPVSRWKATASSFQQEEGEPENAVDGDPDTFWHSRYSPNREDVPHTLELTAAEPMTISAIRITPRQDMENGRVKEYAVQLSMDGQTWGEPILTGTLPNRRSVQTLRLPTPQRVKAIRFVVKSDWSGGNYGAIGEIEPVEAKG